MKNTQIICAIVEHRPGVLYKVSNMFRRRNYNIESIAVGPAEIEGTARMTITVNESEQTTEQVIKQLNKLVEVIKVNRLDASDSVAREMALVKVHVANPDARSDIVQYANIFRNRIIDVSPDSMTIEVTGDPSKIDAFTELMKGFGIKEIARTGITALARGARSMKLEE
jgi:acetolactate synthase-1/3 small subunit